MSGALDELLRRIEDAIDAHQTPGHAGCVYVDEQAGVAVVRAVLEQPLPEVDVCQHCRGRAWLNGPGGDTYWCRPCNGIGYVERAPLVPPQHCPTCSPHIPHGTGSCPVAGCRCASLPPPAPPVVL